MFDASERVMLHRLAATTAQRLRRQRFSEARYEQAVDQLVAAYVDWREQFSAARDAYGLCEMTSEHTARHAFAAYFAALDREERAAAEYQACVEQVRAVGSLDRGVRVIARAGSRSAPAPSRKPQERV